MGFTVLAEVVANNSVKTDYSGADDLLSRFGLKNIYALATNAPPSNPYAKLKHAIDRRLYKSDRWLLASVAEWPEHEFQPREFSREEIRRALLLGPGGCDLREEERGVALSPVVMPTASEGAGPSEVTTGSRPKIKTKIKLKTAAGTAKRPRMPSQEPPPSSPSQADGLPDGSKTQRRKTGS